MQIAQTLLAHSLASVRQAIVETVSPVQVFLSVAKNMYSARGMVANEF